MKCDFKLLAGTIGAGLLLSTSGNSKTNMVEKAGLKPNIVFILADDLGFGDVGFQGQKKFKTPNIDKLAAKGLVFTNHYSGCTVSAPSRCCLFTGYHTGHAYIRGNREHTPEGQEPLVDSVLTVTELFKTAGYSTGVFGKWGLGSPGSEGDPLNQGVDEFFGYNCQTLAHNYYPYYLWHNREKITLKGNADTMKGEWAPDVIHKQALAFLEQNKNRPFFLFYPTTIPHAELVAPEKLMTNYRGKMNPEKIFKGVDEGPTYRHGPYGSQTEAHAAFAAMVTRLDEQVGEIVLKLEELGIAHNTLILFSSDNGPHLEGGADPDYFDSNGPYRGYKRDLTEGGIHVPFIAFWPGKIKPGITGHVSAFWDFLPTCCDLAGIESPRNLDGISYFPMLNGDPQKQQKHDYLYWEFHEKGTSKAILMGQWKGIKMKLTLPLELYNLESDPGETTNIANNHPVIARKLEELMLNGRTESALWKLK
jgi:arylsulfatase A